MCGILNFGAGSWFQSRIMISVNYKFCWLSCIYCILLWTQILMMLGPMVGRKVLEEGAPPWSGVFCVRGARCFGAVASVGIGVTLDRNIPGYVGIKLYNPIARSLFLSHRGGCIFCRRWLLIWLKFPKSQVVSRVGIGTYLWLRKNNYR